MRDTLLWRLRTFRQEMPLSVRHCRIFHALPKSCQDSLSRPIVLCSAARLSELAASTEDLRSGIVHLMEALRLLLYNRDTKIQQILSEEDIDNTTLQYTLVLDVKDVSVRTMVCRTEVVFSVSYIFKISVSSRTSTFFGGIHLKSNPVSQES